MKTTTKALIRSKYVWITDKLKRTPFAKPRQKDMDTLIHSIELSQRFMPNATLESKKHNLREAAKYINKVVIYPGEVFSFWHVVGNPNNKQRFMEGRSIHGGVLSTDVGGGLCQASGIIHHLALLAGMEVIERFNHSVDIYTDETRFAPLGTDATVFFGFKDLRLRNTLTHPVAFELIVEANQLRCILKSKEKVKANTLHYDISIDQQNRKHVNVTDENGNVISQSTYQTP